jgi:NADH-quinone oxidoreductase subunit F
MPDFEPILLRRVGTPDSQSLASYRADGGYRALHKALFDMDPAKVAGVVKDAGLRGRGGAGFPTGVKWTFLPQNHPGPIYLCVNADESEPCTFNNRVLMEDDPHQVLEGILLASYATRARTAYLYLRYEYGRAYRVLQTAIDELYANNLAGQNILGKGFNLDIYLHRGAGAYICGEETGLIESAHQAAVSRRRRRFPKADGGQQHRNPGVRHAHHRPRAGVVQVDRHSARSEEPARRRQLWAEIVLHQRARQQTVPGGVAARHQRARIGG